MIPRRPPRAGEQEPRGSRATAYAYRSSRLLPLADCCHRAAVLLAAAGCAPDAARQQQQLLAPDAGVG